MAENGGPGGEGGEGLIATGSCILAGGDRVTPAARGPTLHLEAPDSGANSVEDFGQAPAQQRQTACSFRPLSRTQGCSSQAGGAPSGRKHM